MAKVKSPIVWNLSSETKADDGETIFLYTSGEKIVKFKAGKAAFSWVIYATTNVPARMRNKVIDSYISARSSKKDYKTLEIL